MRERFEVAGTAKSRRHSIGDSSDGAEADFYTKGFYPYKGLISVIINYTNIEHSKYGQKEGCNG